jgi:single-stranded DNA-binding protein
MSLQAVWPTIADIGEPFLAKGAKVYVEGQLRTASGRAREVGSATLRTL